MKKLLITLLLIPSLASADKLILGGVSKHIGYPVPLNEACAFKRGSSSYRLRA